MHPEIGNRKAEIAELCGRFGVVRLDVFGSAARGTDFDPERSDADFAVEFRRVEGLSLFAQYMDFLHALRTLLGRRLIWLSRAAAAVNGSKRRSSVPGSRSLRSEALWIRRLI